ncbi:MAG: c-type cytochrome, partial [Pseudomonadales bacterium]
MAPNRHAASVDGDVARGQQAFSKFKCNDCHSVAGLDELREGVEPVMTVPLGGETTRINTYGELVTSIINPSHKISKNHPSTQVEENGQSIMRNYNDVLTVTEMINLVAFLQAQYQLQEYYRT